MKEAAIGDGFGLRIERLENLSANIPEVIRTQIPAQPSFNQESFPMTRAAGIGIYRIGAESSGFQLRTIMAKDASNRIVFPRTLRRAAGILRGQTLKAVPPRCQNVSCERSECLANVLINSVCWGKLK